MIPYSGNFTNCYTKAVLTAIMEKRSTEAMYQFEIATTVPFGMIYRKEDPNRLLDCYLDPNDGIDLAFTNLGIPYEMQYWGMEKPDDNEAIDLLKNWCQNSKVILGPLNMGDLKIYFRDSLYQNMDHYIVAYQYNNGFFKVSDSEGMPCVYVKEENLKTAWKADKILEGYGKYIMRKTDSTYKNIGLSDKQLHKVFMDSINNMERAAALPNGGSNGLKQIVSDIENSNKKASLIRGLSYSIPTRIQRCMLMKYLISNIKDRTRDQDIAMRLVKIEFLLSEQIKSWSQLLLDIKSIRKKWDLLMRKIAENEEQITDILISIKDFIIYK